MRTETEVLEKLESLEEMYALDLALRYSVGTSKIKDEYHKGFLVHTVKKDLKERLGDRYNV